jgi:hypothetical protein
MSTPSLFDRVLHGFRNKVERKALSQLGEFPDVIEAKDQLVQAQQGFYAALRGVVETNERLLTSRGRDH